MTDDQTAERGRNDRMRVMPAQALGQLGADPARSRRILEQPRALHVATRVAARGEREMAGQERAALAQKLDQPVLLRRQLSRHGLGFLV